LLVSLAAPGRGAGDESWKTWMRSLSPCDLRVDTTVSDPKGRQIQRGRFSVKSRVRIVLSVATGRDL
jgi:hypothetical protein